MAIVGVVGLPGSGKSTFISRQFPNHQVFDDLGQYADWNAAIQTIRAAAVSRDVVVTDILLCCHAPNEASLIMRTLANGGVHIRGFNGLTDFSQCLCQPITWNYFANDPLQCAKNCVHRDFHKDFQKLQLELQLIKLLTQYYLPPPGAIQVPVAV